VDEAVEAAAARAPLAEVEHSPRALDVDLA
jgi:hypothetical protein